ncbi:DExH-box ATP-dependent RNA helicase DExH15 chloroplastic [Cryptomeria japonica]|uniref:DExH-box ATP-dependent RNA helicase DExH15 chloroplastic n=1 Tax=Cryptomeria japonica TaxID=3369 RepID=UPI0027DA157F|nr:DExH-box ATP-dependent RNA helicase DExH15 chloroplastic [Cryptomeria japonica]
MFLLQRLAIESFLKGSSVVVCAPTSSGKTLIGEAAALATVAKGKRLLYTTPLKALSNQKFREFRETFGEKNVGLLTGDAAVNREAPILIMTTEILRNMLYQSVNTVSEGSGLEQVDFIVLDEVHYLSDISRGTVWEETVIYCPKEVQLICLSATISNPEELAGWIGQVHGPTDLVISKRRPVPLTWHFSRKKSLSHLLNPKATNMNRSLSITRFLQKNSLFSYDDGTKRLKGRKAEKRRYHKESASHGDISELSEEDIKTIRRSQVPLVSDTLMHLRTRDMLPSIWFVFSRKGCDDAVQYLEDSGLLNDEEQLKVDSALKEFQAQYPEAVRENAVMYLLQGVAAHHAGCLPLWKSFIEELFQQGLIKVVFATETLAAGINMPARTTVLSSVSKRGDNGHSLLSSNALLQMAGRAGRRGIDKEGHVVLVQTPFEGAEECCKLLFAGPDPLVSQFSASYGMVLNLLSAKRLTPNDQHPNGSNAVHMGRTLEEARALIEQSFGNYVSSEVMIAAKDQLEKMQREIENLELEISDETLYENIKAKLSKEESSIFFVLLEQLKAMRLERLRAHQQMERVRVSALKPLLEKSSGEQIHFICLQYNDKNKTKHSVPALFVGKINTSSYIGLESKMEEWYPNNDDIDQYGEAISDEMDVSDNLNGLEEQDLVVSYYVALGSDNTWYLFTEKWIKAIYKSGLPDVPLVPGDPPSREILKKKLEEVNTAWEKVGKSQYGDLWRAEGAIDTWSWSLNVPLLHNLSAEDEIIMPKEFIEAQRTYREGKKLINTFQRRLRSTEWYKEFQRLSDLNHVQKEKIERLKAKASRIKARISQIEPTGWRDFLQVGEVLHEAQALDINTQLLYPLGETASKIRGANELWLAMAIKNECLIGLKPSQLAAVCGSLVSEGIKIRPTKTSNYVYEVSNVVGNAIEILEEQRSSLLQLQAKHRVEISCDLDMQFAGIVEAWASGLTWREIMMDCGVDDGDLARLLRRTIDLLSQIPVLPEVDPTVQKSAKLAARMMDRSPISELVG